MKYYSFLAIVFVFILLCSCRSTRPHTEYHVVNQTNHHWGRHRGYGVGFSRKERYYGRHRYGNRERRFVKSITY